MAKYGEVAIRAVGLLLWESGTSPVDAWAAATDRVYPDSRSSRDKGCPKGAFLGLCEDGVVAGVPRGSYTRSVLNKGYAVRALAALRASPGSPTDQRGLWTAATNGQEVQPNSQMEGPHRALGRGPRAVAALAGAACSTRACFLLIRNGIRRRHGPFRTREDADVSTLPPSHVSNPSHAYSTPCGDRSIRSNGSISPSCSALSRSNKNAIKSSCRGWPNTIL